MKVYLVHDYIKMVHDGSQTDFAYEWNVSIKKVKYWIKNGYLITNKILYKPVITLEDKNEN